MAAEYYDATTERDYFAALQRRINDGSIWKFEGSAGRAAMDAIENGQCVLGREGHRGYWGNYVPSRSQVKRGTKGTTGYACKLQGQRYARWIGRVQ